MVDSLMMVMNVRLARPGTAPPGRGGRSPASLRRLFITSEDVLHTAADGGGKDHGRKAA